MTLKFVEFVYEAIRLSGYSIKYLAAELNKAPSTLYDELNPMPSADRTAKLGLEDAVRIMEIIGDTTPLQHIANHFDMNTEPRTATPDKPCVDKEMLDDIPALSDYQEAMKNNSSLEYVGQQLGSSKMSWTKLS